MSTDLKPQPLTPIEERMWRVLIRLMVQLPRAIDEDLTRRTDLSLTRYVVLMRLSETPGGALRMSDLAEATSISPSRMTRVIQSMVADGLISRRAAPDDGRASLAALTDKGSRRLEEAWPSHLAGVRALVLDHIAADDVADFGRVTERLLRAIENPVESGPDAGCPPHVTGAPRKSDFPRIDPTTEMRSQ